MEEPLPYKQKVARSVLASPTIFIWWFAALSFSGEIAYFEYVKQSDCEIVQQNYSRVLPSVTHCLWK